MNNKFLKNLGILISTGLIIKGLGMLNRVLLNRFLGIEVLIKYALFTPTMILFLSLSDYSLPLTMQKFIANETKKENANIKGILKNAFTIMLNVNLILSILLVISAYYITNNLLLEPNLYKPLLLVIPLMFFVSFSGILKGFLQGLELMSITSRNNLYESLLKMGITLFIIFYFNTDVYTTIIYIVIGLNIEEFISCLYLVRKIKKLKLISAYQVKESKVPMLKMSTILTLNRLISSATTFLEPIIYTFCLISININIDYAKESYALITSYALGLLMTSFFLSHAISVALLPVMTKNNNSHEKLNKIISKALFISFVPSIIISIIYFYDGGNYLKLIYDIDKGGIYVSFLAIPFMFSYFEGIFYVALHAIGKTKTTFFINILSTIIKLLALYIFTRIPAFNVFGLCFAYALSNISTFLFSYFFVRKNTSYKIKIQSIVLTILLFLVISFFFRFLEDNNVHFVIKDLLGILLYSSVVLIYYKKYFRHSHIFEVK